jgi:hypothetical protein
MLSFNNLLQCATKITAKINHKKFPQQRAGYSLVINILKARINTFAY